MLRRWRRFVREQRQLERSVELLAANVANLTAAVARREASRSNHTGTAPTSTVCTQAQCEGPEYERWCAALGQPVRYQRKQWELVYICRALEARGMLAPGKRGLGFGVGQEPLAALFASRGCTIVATDLALDEAAERGWTSSGYQHARSLEQLNADGLCPADVFAERVTFRTADMNAIPRDLEGFDFCWSACAFEHLGSLDQGMRFVRRSLDCLRPGGVAVHTTEYNLSSNDSTVSRGGTVLYRRRDLEDLVAQIRAQGDDPMDFDAQGGEGLVDGYVDVPPYHVDCHLRLEIEGYTCTSAGVIAIRGER